MCRTTLASAAGFTLLTAADRAPAAEPVAKTTDKPSGEVPPLAVISGKPRERGLLYGRTYREDVRQFLDKEIYGAFVQKPSPKDDMLRYAAACGKVVKEACPEVYDEMEGLAEGASLRLEEVLLLSLHEEFQHRGVLPKVPHCTAVAAGPPATADGRTLVGQTWDWMQSVYGLSRILDWRRGEGPSVLSYGFPGLWCGAGLNSAGIALTWTSAGFGEKQGLRVGVPSYALLTHLLYQDSLEAAIKEAQRDKHAGWFTFVLGDGEGKLVNIEGSPQGIAIERSTGTLTRVGYGSRQMTATPEGKPVKLHARCDKVLELVKTAEGKVDLKALQGYFADPKCGISVGKSTIDMMVFDCTNRVAHLSRGPSYRTEWKEFRFAK
jgi:hypothetical protein